MQAKLNLPDRVRQIAAAIAAMVALAATTRADIYQWEYVDPADPSQGKRQSTTLAPDGVGVDAVPGANLEFRNLTMAYLIGADLTSARAPWANLTNADLSQANVSNTDFVVATLTNANFRNANLTNAYFGGATLTDADFTGAQVREATFRFTYGPGGTPFGTGITLAQLYATASYQASDLRGIGLSNDLRGGNFAGQNLTNANFNDATLTDTNFREANLTKALLLAATLTGANFREANLGHATFNYAALTDANFTDAEVRGASFYKGGLCGPFGCDPVGTGITLPQLYSTASYQAHDLTGIDLRFNDLQGANFAGQNLANADFFAANLTGANFREADLANASFGAIVICGRQLCRINATITGADFTAADARGSEFYYFPFPPDTITANLIWPDGHIAGLDLDAGGLLIVRDYDAPIDYLGNPLLPIPLTVDQHLAMGTGGTLRMLFEADAWDSTISFAPGIPVALGGTLELTFAADVNLATQIGRTFDLFDWTGVAPVGAFDVSSPYAWDTSNLYATGEVTLTAIPEPAGAALIAAGALGMAYHRRRNVR